VLATTASPAQTRLVDLMGNSSFGLPTGDRRRTLTQRQDGFVAFLYLGSQ
jgi:hypothetical protein